MDTDDDKVSDGKEILIGTDPLVYEEIFDVTATAEDEDSVIVSTQVELLGEQVESLKARNVLRKFGVGINDAENGVYLPTVKKVSEATYHHSMHTNDYYKEVNRLIVRATSKEEVLDSLYKITKQLEKGSFGN